MAAKTPAPTASRAPDQTGEAVDPYGQEAALLARVRWILGLHVTAGTGLFLVTVLYWAMAPMPGGLAANGVLVLAVYAYTIAGAALLRLWQRGRWVDVKVAFRVLLNALAFLDLIVLMTAVHLGGGVDAPGLHLVVIPMAVYGAFLPRVDGWVHAAFAAILLAGVLAGQMAGWLVHVCPPFEGMICRRDVPTVVLQRYLSVLSLMLILGYLTSFVGRNLRQQEQSARRLAAEQGRLAAMRGRFVNMASHEFRTPLAVILAATDVLDRYGQKLSEESTRARIDRIRHATHEMTTLLDEVLELGKTEAPTRTLTLAPVRPADIAIELIEDARLAAREDHQLRLECTAGSDPVLLDRHLVTTVLRNLLGNALKYSPEGGLVEVRVHRAAGDLVFEVADQGIGIPEGERTRLLEPFARGSNVAGLKGTGLGLAIAHAAIRAHGGHLSIESNGGVGTRMTVTIPASPAPTTSARPIRIEAARHVREPRPRTKVA